MILEQARYVLISFWVTPLSSLRISMKLGLYFAIFSYLVPFSMLCDRAGGRKGEVLLHHGKLWLIFKQKSMYRKESRVEW